MLAQGGTAIGAPGFGDTRQLNAGESSRNYGESRFWLRVGRPGWAPSRVSLTRTGVQAGSGFRV